MTLAQQKQGVEPSLGAVCPEHTGVAAVSTCERCGRYVCDDCQSVAGYCTTCQRLTVQGLPSSAGRARVATFFLWAGMAVEACNLVAGAMALSSPEERTGLTVVEGLLGIGELTSRLGTVIAFLMWLHLSVRQTKAMGVDIGETPGWAVGWWFVPFANLTRPYRVVRQLVVGVGGETLAESLAMPLWWGLWLGGNILGNIQGRLATSELGASSSAYDLAGMASSALAIGGAYFCARIIREVQAHLDLRRGENREPSVTSR